MFGGCLVFGLVARFVMTCVVYVLL